MAFVPRTTSPTSENPYYTKIGYQTSTGLDGLNPCILGSPMAWNGSVLANCVGYAWGRTYEITGEYPTLSIGDAFRWYGYTEDGYPRGGTPKLGAVMCWYNSAHPNEGGHVAIVESFNGNQFTTSNSAYNGGTFYQRTYTIGESYNWFNSLGEEYIFQGFIYSYDEPVPPPPHHYSKLKLVYYPHFF